MDTGLSKIQKLLHLLPPREVMDKLFRFRMEIQDLYFITDGMYVKIGVSGDIKSRLNQLQTANPLPLKLLLSVEYGQGLEIHYHNKFKHSRVKGEWFRLTPDIIEEIELLISDNEWVALTYLDYEPQIIKYLTKVYER